MAPSLSGQSCNMKTPVLAGNRAKVGLFQVLYFRRPVRRDMTEWTLLKRLLDAVHQHSTMIGRLWLTVMVIFRLLIVAVATEDVYTDEQEMFVCNTLQPGCPNVCYDAFAPISQPRFWVFQIITVSTPSLCFIIYTWHNLSKHPEGEQAREAYGRSCDSDSCSIKSHKHLGHSLADVLEGIANQSGPKSSQAPRETGAPSKIPGVLSKYYVFHVCFRAVLEVAFVVAQWLLFGFHVPAHFVCTAAPCTQRVDCYVSRPTEKTIFLIFMFCVGVFCIFLNFLELNHLGWKMIKKSMLIKDSSWRGYGAINQDSQSIASLTFRDVTSTTSLPTLDLVVDHQPDWTCVGNCSTKKDKDTYRGTQSLKGKSQPNKERKSKQRSTEVWI
ncbi:gap junction protein delta 6 [Rhinichthys klamathensis goyatoka]|uniref:gap junction protein delta 6 n=1 Tax=Rhinichthys klamathensis goyatoka TaxID=3034132 RepID=UPI0024B62B8A|nr:gap junction protein delta 6 [Rhinichthys klamathensis goyatoka]